MSTPNKVSDIATTLRKLKNYNDDNDVEKMINTIEELKEIEIEGKKFNLKDPIDNKYLKGYSLLYWTCYLNLENLLNVLIDNYSDEIDVDIYNKTTRHRSYHAACIVGNLDMFKKLYFLYIKKKIKQDYDEENDDKKKVNIEKYLETHDKRGLLLYDIINKKTTENCNSFYFACLFNHLHMVEYFYNTIGEDNKSLIESVSQEKNNNDETPLHIACKYNSIETVKFLLDNKLYKYINKGENIKIDFVRSGKGKYRPVDLYNFSYDKKTIFDIKYYNLTLLHIAIIYGNKEIIELLVKHGSDVFAKTKIYHNDGSTTKSTPYTLMCDIIHNIDFTDKNNNALLNKYDEVIKLFIKNGWNKDSSLFINGYCAGKEKIHYAKKGEEYKNPLHPRSPSRSSTSSKKNSSKKTPSKGGKLRKTRRNQ